MAVEGKPANLDNSKQNAPVRTEPQRNEHNKEEEARKRETVRRSMQIADRGQKLDYSEYPRYDP